MTCCGDRFKDTDKMMETKEFKNLSNEEMVKQTTKVYKEFNLKGKYIPRRPRKVICLICEGEFRTKTNAKTCGKECARMRKKQLERGYAKEHREMIADSVRKYAQKNKKKINVKAMANYYIKIPRGQSCQFKGCRRLATEKHHEDYDKPLVVKFYCREHHKFVHRRKK